jgi:hypothetical protein
MITGVIDSVEHAPSCEWWYRVGPTSCTCGALGSHDQADGFFAEQDDAIKEHGGAA